MYPRAVWRLMGVLLALLMAGSAGAPPATRALPLDARMTQALVDLLQPISDCIGRQDTPNAAFHGCYDWHSAVHANLALRLAARMRSDADLRRLADGVATAERIALERSALEEGRLDGELPYGYAWLLLLDVHADRADIHAAASIAAGHVRTWVGAAIDDRRRVLATRYANAAFPVYALHRWYSRFNPSRAQRFAAFAGPRLAAHRPAACASDVVFNGFFDPCASLLLALSRLAEQTNAIDERLLSRLGRQVASRRVVRAAETESIFQAGLNFTRAWALYAAASATGDASLADAGDHFFHRQLAQPELWRENYADYSHWVAQFGVYALHLRAEVRPDRAPTTPLPLPRPRPPAVADDDRHVPLRLRPI